MRGEVLFLLSALYISCSSAQLHYTPSGSCEREHTCVYLYAVEQTRFTRNADGPITATANVQIACESSGTYGSVEATRYCMTIEDIDGNFLLLIQDDGTDSSKIKQYLVEQYLAGWFCFVQTSEGEVVSVYHSREEQIEAVNFKKSIAAAFQTNFMGTEKKIETDQQSKHISHYSYQQDEDGSSKIHRIVMTEDVVEYPMHVSPHDIQLVKEEDVEYREGTLSKSNGTTHVSFDRKLSDKFTTSDTSGDDSDIDIFTFDGSFSIELQVCRLDPQATRKRRAITRQYLASESSTEESLMAAYNETKMDLELLKDIRNELGSGETFQHKLQKLNDTHTVNLLEKSMVLENMYGPPEGFLSVTHYVLNYLRKLKTENLEDTLSKRAIIYSLLSSEGSQRSQGVLIRSFKSTANNRERTALIVAIATVSNPNVQFIGELEMLINLRANPTDPLLLAYGAVTANAAPDLQKQMVSFLTERLPEAEADEAALVHLIHSLGNTRSERVIEHVVRFVDYDEEIVKVTAITALRFFSGLSSTQQMFVHILMNNATEVMVSAIIDVMSEGLEQDENMEILRDIIAVLLNVTLTLNNRDLELELEGYFRKVGTEDSLALAHILEAQRSNVTDTSVSLSRHQRSTVRTSHYWPSSNSDYNVIASQSSRESDNSLYPHSCSFLCSVKKGRDSGKYQAYIQAAAGVFGGVNSDLNFKAFGKIVLHGHLFGKTVEAVNIHGQLKSSGRNIRKKVYIKIAGRVLFDVDKPYPDALPDFSVPSSGTQTSPFSKTYSLYSKRLEIFSFSYPVFIYMGTVDFSVSFHMSLNGITTVSSEQHGIGSREVLSHTPRAEATLEGSVSYSFLAVARVGASLSGSITYEIGAELTTTVCRNSLSAQKQTCTNVFQEWPRSSINLNAWYQSRGFHWCGGWIRYPCFSWGDVHNWGPLSIEWPLHSSSGRHTLFSHCCGSADCNLE